MYPWLEGFTMKSFQALDYKAVLLVLIIHGGVECRPVQGEQQHIMSEDAHLKSMDQTPSERVKIEIIERPKELKVVVNGAPTKEQTRADKDKKGLKQLQQDIKRLLLKSTGLPTVNKDPLDPAPNYFIDKGIYTDDDDWISGSGDDSGSDSSNFRDSSYGRFVSRDSAARQKKAGNEPTHHKKESNDSGTTDFGGAGILLSLVVIAFVPAVVSCVFVRRLCCMGTTPDVARLESVKVERNGKVPSSHQSALKEARIKVGKQKSQENRKVLRILSEDQGVKTEKEELAVACSIIAPPIETRRKNSEALHTRACIRAATSHSGRNSSFEEDLQKARCEFVNAPVRFAKIVSLAGDEKQTPGQDSNSQAAESDPQ